MKRGIGILFILVLGISVVSAGFFSDFIGKFTGNVVGASCLVNSDCDMGEICSNNFCFDVCQGDFDCDGDVDGSDAAVFKEDFGRSGFNDPCTDIYSCKGDFDCDGDVDGTDAAVFKGDFGRSSFNNPCIEDCVGYGFGQGSVSCDYEPDLECNNTDSNETYPNGRNYYERGTIRYIDREGEFHATVESCSSLYLREWFCEPNRNNAPIMESYNCSLEGKICRDGACVNCGNGNCNDGETCLEDSCCNGVYIGLGNCCNDSDCTLPFICNSSNMCEDFSKECSDEIDNDGDGQIDLMDGGCIDINDDDESNCGDMICEGGENISSCSNDCFLKARLRLATIKDEYSVGESVLLTGSTNNQNLATSTVSSVISSDIPLSNENEIDSIDYLEDFEKEYGDEWIIEIDEKSKAPKKIFGSGFDKSKEQKFITNIRNNLLGLVSERKLNPNEFEDVTKSFIQKNEKFLKVKYNNLNKKKIKCHDIHNKKRFCNAIYQQRYNELPVYNGYLMMHSLGEKVVLYESNYYNDIDIDTSSKLNLNEAIKIAKKHFDIISHEKIKDSSLLIYPKDQEYYLAYKIDLPIKEETTNTEHQLSQYTVFVDANSGQIIDYFDNIEYDTTFGNVKGEIFPSYFEDDKTEEFFSDEWIYIDGIQIQTDSSGYYQLDDVSGTILFDSYLEGPWVKVINMQQESANHQTGVNSPYNYNLRWNVFDNSYKQEESNMFYHINLMHDFITKESLNVTEMNDQIQVQVNLPYVCNAASGGWTLYFYSAGSGCESTALDAGVIYHEYQHSVNREIITISWPYSGETGNMNEGIADYFGCSILDDPCHGRYQLYRQCGRYCNSSKRYPQDYGEEPHYAAEIISSSFWHLREILGAEYVDSLAINALRLQPSSFSDLLEKVIIVDDDNEDLSDGTPNINDICNSFYERHGIFSDLCIAHTQDGIAVIESPNPTQGKIVAIGNTLTIIGTAYGSIYDPITSYLLEYSNDDGNTWSSNGITYSGATGVIQGNLGWLDTTNLEAGKYEIRLTVFFGQQQISSPLTTILIDDLLKTGWPKYMESIIETSPLIGDLDLDGDNDILIDVHRYFHAFNYNGSKLNGWESPGYHWGSVGKPALADIDLDGDNEVLWGDGHGYVNAYHHDGRSDWKFETDGASFLFISGSITLGNLNTDDYPEIIFGSYDKNLYVLDYNGNLIWNYTTIAEIQSSPSIGDLNGDGSNEIVINSYNRETQEYIIYVFNGDGSFFIDPINVPLDNPDTRDSYRREPSPALADLDGDDDLEIILGFFDGTLGVWHHDGSQDWRVELPNASRKKTVSPAVGDIDNDGDLEIVIGGYTNVYAYHHDGSIVDGWPQTPHNNYYVYASPVLADIDSDGYLEIFVASFNKLQVYEYDGEEIYSDSFMTMGIGFAAPSIGDLDNNGKTDIVFGSYDNNIYVWELDTDLGTGNIGWPSWNANDYNTGEVEHRPRSRISNYGEDIFNGYLQMKVQKKIGQEWNDVKSVVNYNEIMTINGKQILELDTLWDLEGGYNTTETGEFRVYSDFKNESGDIIKTESGQLSYSWEFEVV